MGLLIVGKMVCQFDHVAVTATVGVEFWIETSGALWAVAVLGGAWTGCDLPGREVFSWSAGGAIIRFSGVAGDWGRVITVESPGGGRSSGCELI